MIALLLFLILAVIVITIFSHMALYVIGAVIGLLLILVVSVIKRRRQK